MLILYAIFLSICFFNFYLFPGSNWSGMSNAMEVDEQTEHQEPFPFAQLPLDVQKEIASYMWVAQDSDAEFRQRLLDWNYTPATEDQTDRAERALYGFNGYKIPIHFHTYIDNKPMIVKVGYTLQNAQPSTSGLWYLDSVVTRLFLTQNNYSSNIVLRYAKEIKSRDMIRIEACSLSVHGDLAIVFSRIIKLNNHYLTVLTADQWKASDIIDLDQNNINLYDVEMERFARCDYAKVKSVLFNLQGNKIGIVWYDALALNCKAKWLQVVNAPHQSKELSAKQIMKRLMISHKIFELSTNSAQ